MSRSLSLPSKSMSLYANTLPGDARWKVYLCIPCCVDCCPGCVRGVDSLLDRPLRSLALLLYFFALALHHLWLDSERNFSGSGSFPSMCGKEPFRMRSAIVTKSLPESSTFTIGMNVMVCPESDMLGSSPKPYPVGNPTLGGSGRERSGAKPA